MGGLVTGPGTGTSDSILARLSDGEFVFREAAVSALGVGTLAYMNRYGRLPGYANGGAVGRVAVPTSLNARSGGGVDMGEIAKRITVVSVASRAEAHRIARHSEARGDVVRIVQEEFGWPARA